MYESFQKMKKTIVKINTKFHLKKRDNRLTNGIPVYCDINPISTGIGICKIFNKVFISNKIPIITDITTEKKTTYANKT